MAKTPKLISTFGAARAITMSSPYVRVPYGVARVVYNIPAVQQNITQAAVRTVAEPIPTVRVAQGLVRAIIKGGIENPRVRSWAYTLDGHDFYVLKLGTEEKTFVFDLSTQQWSHWASGDLPRWRTSIGLNWRASNRIAETYGSNVIAGDDNTGILWVLDPDYALDDSVFDDTEPNTFPRVAMGQLPQRGRSAVPCFSVYLSASPGEVQTPTSVTLSYSDDLGHNFANAGSFDITNGDYLQEFAWRSLGQIRAPGRLFKIADNGLARVDSLDVNNENA